MQENGLFTNKHGLFAHIRVRRNIIFTLINHILESNGRA
jgi:hypothetical protein